MKTYKYKVQGVDYEVEIAEVEGKIAHVNVNGIPFEIEMQKPINAAKHPALAATKRSASTAAPVAAPVAGSHQAFGKHSSTCGSTRSRPTACTDR